MLGSWGVLHLRALSVHALRGPVWAGRGFSVLRLGLKIKVLGLGF